MKVLHVIPAVASRYGGPSTAVLGLCRALRSQSVDVRIATTDADGAGRLNLPLATPIDHEGVPTMVFRRVASEAFKFSPGLSRWLASHVREYDVVHIHGVMSHACLAAVQACRGAGVPFVLAPLGTLDAESLEQKPGRKRLFMTCFGREMLASAAAIHCTGHEELETLRGRFGHRGATLLPLGVPDEWLDEHEDAAPRRRDIVCLTRLAPRKGLELLVDAFAQITDHHAASWRLVLAGAGDDAYTAALRARAEGSAAAARILFTGWITDAPKTELLRRASLFALPSFHENFGLSVLEAMCFGTPVVISREVQLAPWVEEAGAGWIAALETGAIAATLSAAMADDDGRRARGRAARQLASRFRWSAIAADTIQLYRRIHTQRGVAAVTAAPATAETRSA